MVSALRLMMMLAIPSAVGLMVLATPIVALIFERGAFTTGDTAAHLVKSKVRVTGQFLLDVLYGLDEDALDRLAQ